MTHCSTESVPLQYCKSVHLSSVCLQSILGVTTAMHFALCHHLFPWSVLYSHLLPYANKPLLFNATLSLLYLLSKWFHWSKLLTLPRHTLSSSFSSLFGLLNIHPSLFMVTLSPCHLRAFEQLGELHFFARRGLHILRSHECVCGSPRKARDQICLCVSVCSTRALNPIFSNGLSVQCGHIVKGKRQFEKQTKYE